MLQKRLDGRETERFGTNTGGRCLRDLVEKEANVLGDDELHRLRCISYYLSSSNMTIEESQVVCSEANVSLHFSSEKEILENRSSSLNNGCGSLHLDELRPDNNPPDLVELNWQFVKNMCNTLNVFVIQLKIENKEKKQRVTRDWKTVPDLVVCFT
ncbi:uncharacterized protein [Antedon mediterranea]|uniref:uncharacterized protein n=1 Tax=Antedon mediterranea TaxID=105859 RepID=UPI003AF9904F